MARKTRKTTRRKSRPAARMSAARKKKPLVRRKKTARRKPAARKRTVRARTRVRPKKAARKPARAKRRPRRSTRADATIRTRTGAGATSRGLGPESGGQSGDIEGLDRVAVSDSESVEELAEEGQAFEAGIVDAVENAPDADQGPIRTREVPEDDVPEEYLEEDED